MQVCRSGYLIINRAIAYTFLSRLVLKEPWAEMERRNLKNNMSVSDLENLFNAYKEYLDFRAASLMTQPKIDRGSSFNKPKDFGKNGRAKP